MTVKNWREVWSMKTKNDHRHGKESRHMSLRACPRRCAEAQSGSAGRQGRAAAEGSGDCDGSLLGCRRLVLPLVWHGVLANFYILVLRLGEKYCSQNSKCSLFQELVNASCTMRSMKIRDWLVASITRSPKLTTCIVRACLYGREFVNE